MICSMSALAQYSSLAISNMRWGPTDECGMSSLHGMLHSPSMVPFTQHATARTAFPGHLDFQSTLSDSGLMQAADSIGPIYSMPSTASFGGINPDLNSIMSNPSDNREERWAPLYQIYPLEISTTSSTTCESSVDNACYGRSTFGRIGGWNSTI